MPAYNSPYSAAEIVSDRQCGSQEESPTAIGFGLKLIYGIGQVPNAMKGLLFGLFSLYFYTTVMGLSGSLVGIATAISLVWDAMIDPIIGVLSDNSRSKWGRRHGYMIIGAVGMGAAFWAFFSPPPQLSKVGLFLWLLLTNLLVRTMTSLFAIPYLALGAELSNDYHERTAITGTRGAFALFGTLITAVLSFVLFFPESFQNPDAQLNISSYHWMGLFAGVQMTLFGLISAFGTLSKRQSNTIIHVQHKHCPKYHFLKESVSALKNQSFRAIFFSYSLFFLATVINATLSIHYLTYMADITSSRSISLFHLSFYLSALTGVCFWMKISKKVEKKWLYLAGTLSTSIILVCAFLLIGKGRLLGAGNFIPIACGNGLAGFFSSSLWIMPASMIADITDQDHLLTKKNRQGIFFGLFNFGEQVAAGASILISGFLVEWFAGLIPGQIRQTQETIERIGMLFSLLPAFLMLAASILILRYKLNEKKITKIHTELKESSFHNVA